MDNASIVFWAVCGGINIVLLGIYSVVYKIPHNCGLYTAYLFLGPIILMWLVIPLSPYIVILTLQSIYYKLK